MFFQQSANKIIGRWQIQVDGTMRLDIVEVEIYYHSADHPDPYVHCHPDQLTDNCWYFHKQRLSYRNGTYKGVDMTFGESGSYGGMLIRSVVYQGELIEGPCRTVNILLRLLGVERIDDLVAFDAPPLSISSPRLRLAPNIEKSGTTIQAGPRVGLSLRSGDAGWYYLMLGYRFVNSLYLSQLKKYKFLINLPRRSNRYRGWFEIGKSKSITDFPRKVTKVKMLCELYGCWWNQFGQ